MTNVFVAISAAQADLCGVGIGKNQTAPPAAGGFNFRGIDDIFNVIGPLMAKHHIVFWPQAQELQHDTYERVVQNKTRITHHFWVKVDYTVVCSENPEISITVTTYGEAADVGDKGLAKAMTSAYKNAIFQLFAPPLKATPLDMDGDATEPTAGELQDSAENPDHTADMMETDIVLLSDKDVLNINMLLKESGADVPAFLQWVSNVSGMSIGQVEDIPLNMVDKIVNTISDKMTKAEQDIDADINADEVAATEEAPPYE